MIDIAMLGHHRPVPVHCIADEEKIPHGVLEQVFLKLTKVGLIRSIRGPGGGFVLNRKPAEISVADILVAVGEWNGILPCTFRRRAPCNRIESCAAHDIWSELQEAIEDYLRSVTLKHIIEKTEKKYEANHLLEQDFCI